MNTIISNITYTDRFSSNASLIKYSIPKEGQTFEFISQNGINSQNYSLSNRNGAGTYIIPTEKEHLYLNFIPQKVFVSDADLANYTDTEFSYFIPLQVPLPDKFTLPEGQIFRCVSENGTPKAKEEYDYYTMVNGKKKKIPNYKTLEVMLAERNQTLLSVRIIPESECSQIEQDSVQITDKESAWKDDFKDQTNPEILKSLGASVASGAAIAESAKASAATQIAAVQAAEEKAKEQAAAAKAQSEADKAASQAAIASANAAAAASQAAQAAAEAAKAQAEQAKAEAEAQKAANSTANSKKV